MVTAVYVVAALIVLIPMSRSLDALLRPVLAALRFRWGETVMRDRMTVGLVRAGDVRGALHVRRVGVEQAVGRGGFELALATASYGMLLLASGWIGEGIEYLTVSARMTHGWPPGRMRDLVLLALAGGHAIRGDVEAAEKIFAAVPAAVSPDWEARRLDVRAFEQLAADKAGDAVTTLRAALDAAQRSGNRDLLIVVNNNLAGALVEAGDYAEAETRLAAGEAVASPTNTIRAHLLGTRAELALARGEIDAARHFLAHSQALKAQMGIDGGIGWTQATKARIEVAAGNREEAKRLLDESAVKLQSAGALHSWRLAAAAIGEPETRGRLAPPEPDPLLDRAVALVRELPLWAWEIQRGTPVALAVGIGLALVWLFVRFHDRLPGGWITVGAFYVLLMVFALTSFILRRFPHLLRATA